MLQITASTYEFEPNDIAVYPGEAVTLKLVSSDVRHTFTVDELDVGVEVQAGKTVTTELTASAERTYTFYCTTVGSRQYGLEARAFGPWVRREKPCIMGWSIHKRFAQHTMS